MHVSKKDKENLEQDSNFMIKVATFIVEPSGFRYAADDGSDQGNSV